MNRGWPVVYLLAVTIFCGCEPVACLAQTKVLGDALQTYRGALDTGDRQLRSERFRQAEMLFRQVIGDHPEMATADLFTNLGNAALQSQRLGPAIAAYRRALQLEPSHRRAQTNLTHARSLLPEWTRQAGATGWLDSLFFWKQLYARETLSTFAACCFLITTLLWASSVFWRQPVLRNLALLPATIWLVLTVSLFLAIGQRHDTEAIVVAPEVVARTADSLASAPRFTTPLPSGCEVTVLDQRESWTQVQLASEDTAWVPSSCLDILDSD